MASGSMCGARRLNAPSTALSAAGGRRLVVRAGPAAAQAARTEDRGNTSSGLDSRWCSEEQAVPAPSLCRRSLLAAAVAAVATSSAAGMPADAAAAPGLAAPPATPLRDRVLTSGDVTSPGNSLFSKPGLIEFPRWMFGEWEVESSFSGFHLPLGEKFADPALVQRAQAPADQGGVGARSTYSLNWYSTLPDTFDNQLRLFVGQMPSDAIIMDRAFDLAQTANAFNSSSIISNGDGSVVEHVDFDTRAPDRATISYAGVSSDMGPAAPRRVELYLNNARSERIIAREDEVDEQGNSTAASALPVGVADEFTTSELWRQVDVGVQAVDVRDFEVTSLYQLLQQPAATVRVKRRVALYLEPREALYFSSWGKAVAVYDFDLLLTRKPAPEDAPAGAVACAATPKGFVQCL